MKTVEIVNTSHGCFITRRYCGMNKGRVYFPNVEGKIKNNKRNKEIEKYIKDWTGE